MIYYCYKAGAHIVSRSIEGLLIRGISEEMIFEVEAENRMEASSKAQKIIKAVHSETSNQTVPHRLNCKS